MGRRVVPPHALAGEGVNERQIELPSHPSLTSARDGEEGGITEREGDRRRTEHGNEARCGCQTRARAVREPFQVQDDLDGAVLFRVAICTFERRDGLPHPSPFNSFARLPSSPRFRRRFPRLERPQISHRFSSSWSSSSATLSCGLSQSVVRRSVACTTA